MGSTPQIRERSDRRMDEGDLPYHAQRLRPRGPFRIRVAAGLSGAGICCCERQIFAAPGIDGCRWLFFCLGAGYEILEAVVAVVASPDAGELFLDRKVTRAPRSRSMEFGRSAGTSIAADDVSPALLARQRHRARHGDQRHRHRALGHPRQGSRCPLPQALGRAGARLCSAVLPPGRRQDGGLLRDRTRRRHTIRRSGAQAVEEGFTAFKSMAVPPTMPLEGLRPMRYAEACVRGDARCGRRRRSTSWSTATPVPPAHGAPLCQGARAVRPLLVRGAVLAGDGRRHRR